MQLVFLFTLMQFYCIYDGYLLLSVQVRKISYYKVYIQLQTYQKSSFLRHMKKLKLPYKEQYHRISKTISPSTTSLKSPRYNKNGYHLIEYSKLLNQEEERINYYRKNQRIQKNQHVYQGFSGSLLGRRSHLEKQKQGSDNYKGKKYQKQGQIQEIQKRPPPQNLQSYNSYYNHNHSQQPAEQQKKQRLAQVSPLPLTISPSPSANPSRKTSTNQLQAQNQQSPSINSTRNTYQQTIRRMANQIIRLKLDCKIMQERCQKLSQEKKIVLNDNNGLRSQVEKLREFIGRNQRNQGMLREQLNNLRRIMQVNSQELSRSNYQIYKMKQQIIQLTTGKNQKSKSKQPKKLSKNELKQSKNLRSQKFLSQPSLQPQPPNICTPCKTCLKSSKQLIQLTNKLQNTKYQLIGKSQKIATLCKQIEKLEAELKIVEKPRLIYKKFGGIIDEVNLDVMKLRARELNTKLLVKCGST